MTFCPSLLSTIMRKTIFFLLVACLYKSATAAECLPYEPTQVTIEGTLTRKTFPCRPNLESISGGDEKLVYWILKLENPVCIGTTETVTDLNEPETEITEIQLAPKDNQFYKRNKVAIGKHVKVAGSLFHQHTAWHVTKVVVIANDIHY
jgi:hypothetical protein